MGKVLDQIAAAGDQARARLAALDEAAEKIEQSFRRAWAEKIREEFGKYHDHSGGGECGACGAIQAANWMDPDYTRDGPEKN